MKGVGCRGWGRGSSSNHALVIKPDWLQPGWAAGRQELLLARKPATDLLLLLTRHLVLLLGLKRLLNDMWRQLLPACWL